MSFDKDAQGRLRDGGKLQFSRRSRSDHAVPVPGFPLCNDDSPCREPRPALAITFKHGRDMGPKKNERNG